MSSKVKIFLTHSAQHLLKTKQNTVSLGVMVDGVVADEQRGVEGLRQQRVDGDHHQQHGQLQHRVQPQEHGAGHHGQDAGEDKILPDTDGQTGTKLNDSNVWLMDRWFWS